MLRKFSDKILGSPIIWEYRSETSLKNIETERGRTIFREDTQTEILIIF